MATARILTPFEWLPLAATFDDQNFEQCLTYGQAAAARIGGTSRLIAIEDAGQVLALAHLRLKKVPGLGRGIAWAPSGPLTLRQGQPRPDAARLGTILAALRQQVCVTEGHVLRLRLPAQAGHDPDMVTEAMTTAGFAPTTKALTYHTILMDLSKDADRTMADLNHKWRTNLRHALKAGLTAERGNDPALRARFLALYERIMAAKGFKADISPEFHYALSGPDYQLETILVSKDGVDLAGAVNGYVGPSTIYLFAATPDIGRELRAGYFLTWEILDMGRARGTTTLDLGGFDPEENQTVRRFKDYMNGTTISSYPYQTDAGGLLPALIRKAEALRHRLRPKPKA